MAEHTVTLHDGLTVGDKTHKGAVLRDPTTADILDAAEDAERLVSAPDGTYQLVASPTRTNAGILARQIVRIGDHQGPLTREELGRLSPRDWELLQAESDKIDAAVVNEAQRRGRGAAASG